jgi:hypothetical protein
VDGNVGMLNSIFPFEDLQVMGPGWGIVGRDVVKPDCKSLKNIYVISFNFYMKMLGHLGVTQE